MSSIGFSSKSKAKKWFPILFNQVLSKFYSLSITNCKLVHKKISHEKINSKKNSF